MKKIVKVKNIYIGGDNRIPIQSMTNTDTLDADATVSQVLALEKAGCDIVRLAVSSSAEVESCKQILKRVSAPLVADIQFDYKLAILCADAGFSKIRFNPGNIGGEDKVRELVAACKANGVPIRIGVNSGSLEKNLIKKYGVCAKSLGMSALNHVAILERFGFEDIIVSVKSSSVKTMIEANRILDKECDYPLHIGVTESGAYEEGLLKSAVGIGSLLADNIGDTVRVSLSGDPVAEVFAAKKILRAAGRDSNYCEIVSCPTCSRCKYDLMEVVDKVRELTAGVNKKMKIAVMGCVVNGPGEALDADLGVAGGKEKSVIFKKGEIVSTVENSDVIPVLEKMIAELI